MRRVHPRENRHIYTNDYSNSVYRSPIAYFPWFDFFAKTRTTRRWTIASSKSFSLGAIRRFFSIRLRINVDCRTACPIKRVKNGKRGRKIQWRAGDNVLCRLCVATNFYLSVVCRALRIEKQLTRVELCTRNDALWLPERIKSSGDWHDQ